MFPFRLPNLLHFVLTAAERLALALYSGTPERSSLFPECACSNCFGTGDTCSPADQIMGTRGGAAVHRGAAMRDASRGSDPCTCSRLSRIPACDCPQVLTCVFRRGTSCQTCHDSNCA